MRFTFNQAYCYYLLLLSSLLNVMYCTTDPPAGCDPSAHNNFDTSKCFDFDTCGGGNGDGGGPVACFSKDATVQVETKGTVSMEELQPGDRVMTSNGSFESIYAFGHRSSSHVDKFFKIYIENSERPFEMTSEDLIYTKDGAVAVAVRTDTVKIGDILSSLERPSK